MYVLVPEGVPDSDGELLGEGVPLADGDPLDEGVPDTEALGLGGM